MVSGWPSGVGGPEEYSEEWIFTPGQVTMTGAIGFVRRIHTDGRKHHAGPGTIEADSIGHWEGDTLVVDTIGMNTRTFIDDEGSTHSNKQHVVERFRKIDGGSKLEVTNTIEDPDTLEHPYSYKTVYYWRPDMRTQEYVCEENNRNTVINGITTAK